MESGGWQAWVAIAAALVIGGTSLAQAEPVFPTASRVGLSPPAGFVLSKRFVGFENLEKQAAIMIAELPAPAYEEIERGTSPEALKGEALVFGDRSSFALKDGKGFIIFTQQMEGGQPYRRSMLVASFPDMTAIVNVLVPDAARDLYPDDAINAALRTTELRAVPQDEQLSALPFSLGDLAGFRLMRVQPGAAAMLTDGPKDSVEPSEQPLLLITMTGGAKDLMEDRTATARRLFGSIPGVKDIRLTRAEPLRIGGQQGHEIVAEARNAKDDTEIGVVQWLRFGPGTLVRIVGIAPKKTWTQTFSRFRALRDGIQTK